MMIPVPGACEGGGFPQSECNGRGDKPAGPGPRPVMFRNARHARWPASKPEGAFK
jgi:hypothetical protein